MSTLAEIATVSPERPDEVATRPLTIFAIGYAQSTHVQARVRCFAERGHKVYLLTETAVEPGIPGVTQLVPALDPDTATSRLFAALSWFNRKLFGINTDHLWRALVFLKFLRATRPDIVHVHFAYAYYAWMAALMGCRPLVVTVMGGDVLIDEQGSPTREGKWLMLQLFRNADYITSKSNYLTAELDRLGGFGAKAERIFWGIPVARLRRRDAGALRAELGLKPQQRVILSPRILQPLYQVDLIVEAMPRILSRHPDAILLITEYGADAAYRTRIVERVASLGIEKHVRFCGTVQHDQMPQYYWLSEVTVSVPRSDGMPQTLIEAMACETPNVLNKLPQYCELVVHEESAFFVDTDPESLAEGVSRLLADRELCARIAANALAIVQKEADLGEQARRVERRYLELAANCRPRRCRPGHFIATALALRGTMRGAR